MVGFRASSLSIPDWSWQCQDEFEFKDKVLAEWSKLAHPRNRDQGLNLAEHYFNPRVYLVSYISLPSLLSYELTRTAQSTKRFKFQLITRGSWLCLTLPFFHGLYELGTCSLQFSISPCRPHCKYHPRPFRAALLPRCRSLSGY